MLPKPTEPELGSATADHTVVNFWEYVDCVVLVCPRELVPVTHTNVGDTELELDVLVVVAAITTDKMNVRTKTTFIMLKKEKKKRITKL